MTNSSRFLKSPIAPMLLIAISLAVIAAVWLRPDAGANANTSERVPSGRVFTLDGLERVMSQTPSDWTGVADAVVVGTVTEERRLASPKSETATGDGIDIVGRDVTVRVGKTLWQAPTAREAPAGSIDLSTVGWAIKDDVTLEAAFAGSPRLEVGHTYALALVWKLAECSEGDESTPARWAVIGSGGALPADGGIVGRGEFEGSTVDQIDRRKVPADTVLSSVLGKTIDDLAPLLEKVGPVKRLDFMLGASTC